MSLGFEVFLCLHEKAAPIPEYSLIELQGTLELASKQKVAVGGLKIGTFSISEKGVPLLDIGSHRLEGKLVPLPKPLIITTKQANLPNNTSNNNRNNTNRSRTSNSNNDNDNDSDEQDHNDFDEMDLEPSASSTEYVIGIVRKKFLFAHRPKVITQPSVV